MATTENTQLTDAEKLDIRGTIRQAEEAVALILRIAARRHSTPGELTFPLRALSRSVSEISRRLSIDL